MGVLINRKRCDNADVCPCIAECPAKAFHFDEKEKRVAVDDNLCINCRKCMITCEAGAVKVYRNEEEKKALETEYDCDIMTESDLFQERYGATSIEKKNLLKLENLDDIIKESNRDLIIEFYNEDIAKCLINSIPIEEIKNRLKRETSYRKIEVDNLDLIKKYGVSDLPTLIIISKGEIIFRYCGFVSCKDKEDFLGELSAIS